MTKHIDLVDAHERRQLRQQWDIAREGARAAAHRLQQEAALALKELDKDCIPTASVDQYVARLNHYTSQMQAMWDLAQQLGIEEVYENGWPERNK